MTRAAFAQVAFGDRLDPGQWSDRLLAALNTFGEARERGLVRQHMIESLPAEKLAAAREIALALTGEGRADALLSLAERLPDG